jgi:Do/DeqQ family serine protease
MRSRLFLAAAAGFAAAVLVGRTPGATSRETPVVLAVQKAAPAVVNVYTEKIVERTVDPFGTWRDPFFDEFFRDFFEPRKQRFRTSSLGSGVVIRPDGYVLTNQHVVQRASQIKIKLLDDREFDAELIGADSDSDLAVLKVKGNQELPYIEMGSSADLMIGETVIAIGNPFGLSNTVTVGVVSAQGRSLKSEQQTYYDFIQTDASINPGNSGGPLLNIDGELIGVNAAIYQKAQGIGFAIPIDRARRIVNDLISYGEVHVPWVGLFVQDITPSLARHFGVAAGRGVVVAMVEEDSPASKAGVERGDIIIGLAGAPVGSTEEYDQRLRNETENAAVRMDLVRAQKALGLTLQAEPFPSERADALAWKSLGIRVAEGRDGMRVTEVRRGSPAGRIGFQAGDEIVALGGRPVLKLERFRREVAASRASRSVLVSLRRGRLLYHVTVGLEQ